MATSVNDRVASLFPRITEVPESADIAPRGGTYGEGTTWLVNGEIRRWTGAMADTLSAVCIRDDAGRVTPRILGPAARLDRAAALDALAAARSAWDHGRGAWPTMRVAGRAEALSDFAARMRAVREQTVRLLMWEIGKSRADSEKEFDRTVQYVTDTVEALKETDRAGARFSASSGVLAHIRRSPLGVVLCMGPFNYPLNETFTTLIPALAMGNTLVVKLPHYGALCQAPLLSCFAASFPPGVVNVINGRGSAMASPIMETGDVAALAFIGTSRVANELKRLHPHPNRLRSILGLDAKNPAIVCADAVDALPFGMPWESGVRVTPLPDTDKVARMAALVEDAVSKGAKVANRNGGLSNGTFYFPSVVTPVTPEMELYHVEQFGPVIPVAVFDDPREVFDYIVESSYGQQASVFGNDPRTLGPLIDVLANQVCRVNLNAQCQRGPDVYPFTGRKDSAEGTLSVSDTLRCFSIRSMVAAPGTPANTELLGGILRERTSNFVNTDYTF